MDDLMLPWFKGQSHGFVQEPVGITHSTWIKAVPWEMSAFHETCGIFRNVFHIEDGVITITPMKSRIKAIQKLEHPTTVKGCKSFCGVVNYLSLFCKDLQKILKPIYELTRKEQPLLDQILSKGL